MHVLFPSRESVMRNATEVFIYCLLSDSSYRGAIQTIKIIKIKNMCLYVTHRQFVAVRLDIQYPLSTYG